MRLKRSEAAQFIPLSDSRSDWQVEEIKQAVAEADRNDFATNEEIESTLSQWLDRTGTGIP